MLSFKRFLYIILIVAALGGVFLIYSLYGGRSASTPAPEREFMGTGPVDEGQKPRVWILGDPEDGCCGEIYSNVRQFCRDIRLTVAGEGRLDMDKVKARDLLIFCDAAVSRYGDPEELAGFLAGGGRAILAAGLEEGEPSLWQALGIRDMAPGGDAHGLVFEKALLPLQPEKACYDGCSGSARMELSSGASVYIRDEGGSPILYTYDWQKGSVCLINGSFLSDARCMGLLSGAMGALLPDFIYPVLGVKAVFLDHFPMARPGSDELCRKAYGYTAEGFIQDVVWPVFQGMSLRTGTPYTASVLAAAPTGESFGNASDGLFAAMGRSVLQFGGELAYGADCPQGGDVVFNQDLFRQFSQAFPGYSVQGLVMETDGFPPETLDMPGADIRFVRGWLGGRDTRLAWEDGHTVFPAATRGNAMEDGNLFAASSVLGAYGMVSHVFDVSALVAGEEGAAWDSEKRQVGLFESEILGSTPWLEGRTLSQTGGDVKSYLDIEYGWAKSGSRIELHCSGAAKGQAFFYHTGGRIAGAQGLSYQDVGSGYYLLRMQESRGIITLEEG